MTSEDFIEDLRRNGVKLIKKRRLSYRDPAGLLETSHRALQSAQLQLDQL
ncbi:hypothetical protein [Ruminococcus sp.]